MNRKLLDLIPTFFLSLFGRNKPTTHTLDDHGDDLGIGGDDKQRNNANTGCQSWFAVTKYAFVSDLFSDYESKPETHSLNVRGDNDSSSVESTDDEQQPERDVK